VYNHPSCIELGSEPRFCAFCGGPLHTETRGPGLGYGVYVINFAVSEEVPRTLDTAEDAVDALNARKGADIPHLPMPYVVVRTDTDRLILEWIPLGKTADGSAFCLGTPCDPPEPYLPEDSGLERAVAGG
jgi:hypothetical protein